MTRADAVRRTPIGALVQERRMLMKLSQDDLVAELKKQGIADFPRPSVSALERGRVVSIRPDVANALARILPVSVEEVCQALGFEVALWEYPPEASGVLAILQDLPEEYRPAVLQTIRSLWHGLKEVKPVAGEGK